MLIDVESYVCTERHIVGFYSLYEIHYTDKLHFRDKKVKRFLIKIKRQTLNTSDLIEQSKVRTFTNTISFTRYYS